MFSMKRLIKSKWQWETLSWGLIVGATVLVAVPAVAQDKKLEINRQTLLKVEEIELEGNTVFSDAELKKAINLNKEQKVSLESLIQLRTRISDYYRDRGYLRSGAFMPSQEISNGKAKIQIIEGSISEIDIEGLSRLNKNYISLRLPPLGKTIKEEDLIEALAKLKQDPLIENIKANLKQITPGKNLLLVKIEENQPLTSSLAVTNNYSPSVGTLGGTLSANYHLFGFGDRLGLNYTRTEGLTRYDGSYSFPVNKYNGTIELNYTNADTRIVEDPISALDIQADLEVLGLSARQPISLDEQSDLALAIKLELIESETFVNEDFSFAFVEGLPDGRSQFSALRLIQEYFNRGEESSIGLRSQFSVGLNLFEPTVTAVGRDGLFWSWQGQGQWLKRLDNFLLVSNLNVQLTNDKLLPVEQFTLGGTGSVRGYRQNLAIGDNGITGSVELQMPLIERTNWQIQLIPFIDAGTLWNNASEALNYNTLASIGLGLNYELGNTIEARINYGIPLIEAEAPESFSTEERISFLFLFRP
jgi:hemolysin activation/secretion protein